jgi:hypothetical protein
MALQFRTLPLVATALLLLMLPLESLGFGVQKVSLQSPSQSILRTFGSKTRGSSRVRGPSTVGQDEDNWCLFGSNGNGEDDNDTLALSKPPMLLDPGTKGGALFLSLILFMVPLLVYQIVTGVFEVDGIEAGKWIGVGFTFFTTVLWVSTYIFRVATKDMTYAKQLKDYENAVIAKRLEELDDDEIQALVEDIERDEF